MVNHDDRSNKGAAAYFLARTKRVASKVTALSLKEELTDGEIKELADAMQAAQLYGTIALSHAILALLEEQETK